MQIKTQILKAVEAQLKRITLENGCKTDIGNNFVYWRDFPIDYDGTQGCTFFDEDDLNAERNMQDQRRIKLKVSALTFMSQDAITESGDLVEDILKAVGETPSWGIPRVTTQLKSIEKEIETMGRQACRVEINLEILYICDEWSY